MEQYKIPFIQRSSLKLSMKLLFLFCSIFTVAVSMVFFILIMKDDLIMGLIFGLFMLILGIYFTYIFITAGLLKKFYIELTPEYIKASLPFKTHIAYWNQIYEAQVYNFNHNTMLSILLDKDRNRKSRRTISNNFNSLYGVPPYSFQISLNLFNEVDIEKLLLTIGEHINNADKTGKVNIEALSEEQEEGNNSLIKAVLISMLFCIIMSAIYGFSIYKLEKNYVAIPLLGCFLIISGFNKYYLEETFNLFIRILAGFICLVQVPAAVIEEIILSEKIRFSLYNIIDVAREYFVYLFHNPSKQVAIIVVSLICFAIGIFRGRTKIHKKGIDIFS